MILDIWLIYYIGLVGCLNANPSYCDSLVNIYQSGEDTTILMDCSYGKNNVYLKGRVFKRNNKILIINNTKCTGA